jgi:hypothetical protein
MRLIYVIGLVLVLVPISFSFNCSNVENKADCEALTNYDINAISNLIYSSNFEPNFNFVNDYNSNIIILDAPTGVQKKSGSAVKNMWVKIISVSPSVEYQNKLYVNTNFVLRVEYDYDVYVPPTYTNNKKRSGNVCKIQYSLAFHEAKLEIESNGKVLSHNKMSNFVITKDTLIEAKLTARAKINTRIYEWNYEGYGRWDCNYDRTEGYTNEIVSTDSIQLYIENLEPNVYSFSKGSYGSIQGNFSNISRNIILKTDLSNLSVQKISYSAKFLHQPYYLLQIVANDSNKSSFNNMFFDGSIATFVDYSECSVTSSSFFTTIDEDCVISETKEFTSIQPTSMQLNLTPIFSIGVLMLILYLLYIVLKKTGGKYLGIAIMLFSFVPFVNADECGLSNIAICIPEKLLDYILDVINTAFQPMLDIIKNFLSQPVEISMVLPIWAIMVYIISFFYGLLFFYSGFQFLTSGHDVVRREMAKEWLKNTVLMIVFVQASFYLYELFLNLGAILSSSVLSMVEDEFFHLTADSLANLGLEFLFGMFYVIILLVTILFLALRYLILFVGVAFVPIAVFFYFIPPLQSYGKLILHTLFWFILIGFVDSLIILTSSLLIELDFFSNMKILVMISCFSLIIFLNIVVMWHIISKTGVGEVGKNVANAVKYIAMAG